MSHAGKHIFVVPVLSLRGGFFHDDGLVIFKSQIIVQCGICPLAREVMEGGVFRRHYPSCGVVVVEAAEWLNLVTNLSETDDEPRVPIIVWIGSRFDVLSRTIHVMKIGPVKVLTVLKHNAVAPWGHRRFIMLIIGVVTCCVNDRLYTRRGPDGVKCP